MRSADQIRLDIGATASELEDNETQRLALRKRLGRALIEAREHPDLTLEEGREEPETTIPRQTANRLMREAAA